MSKREWWIDTEPYDEEDVENMFDAYSKHPGQGELVWQSQLVHVIDFQSYQAVVAENRNLREALEYYAESGNWSTTDNGTKLWPYTRILDDSDPAFDSLVGGKRAREALKGKP